MSDALPAVIVGRGDLPAVTAAYDPAQDPYEVYLGRLNSPEGRRTQRGCLDRLARLIQGRPLDDTTVTGRGFPWHQLRYQHTMRVRTKLQEDTDWSPNHINKHLAALRGVLEEAWRLGLMSGEDHKRASDIKNLKSTRVPAGHHVGESAFGATLAACDEDAKNPAKKVKALRDAALLAALYSTGCRRSELAALTMDRWIPESRAFRVIGKGDKERLVYLTDWAAARFEAWLAVRGNLPGAVFPALVKGGGRRTVGTGKDQRLKNMGDQGIADLVKARINQAGAAHRTPHDFRRTFIGELLDAGVDLATAQALVGHSSPATTARYDRRPERTRQEAVTRLKAPKVAPLHAAGAHTQ